MASSMDDLGQDYILRWDPDAEADNDILNSNFSNVQCSPSSSALRAVPSESPQAAPSSSRRGKRPADSDAKSPQSLAQPVRGRNVAKKAKTTAGSVERPVNPRRKKQATPGVESSMSPDQPTQDRKAAKASKKTLPLQEPKTRRGVLARISFSTEEGNLDEVEPFVGVTDLSNSFIDRGAVDRYNIREYPVTKAHSQAETPRGMVDDIRGWVSVQVTSRKLKADGKRLGLRILEASSCGVYFGKDIRDSNRNTRCEEWGPKVTVQGSATGRRQQQMGGVYGVPTRGTTATSIRPDQGATPSTSYRSKPGMSLVSSATQNVTDTGPTSVDWDPRDTDGYVDPTTLDNGGAAYGHLQPIGATPGNSFQGTYHDINSGGAGKGHAIGNLPHTVGFLPSDGIDATIGGFHDDFAASHTGLEPGPVYYYPNSQE